MRKSIALLNVLLVTAVLAGDVLYILEGSLLIKGVTSFGFVLLGAVNLGYGVKTGLALLHFPAMMLTGLVFAMLGDIVLNIHFMVGALLFAIGHICYFAAYCFLEKGKRMDLLFGAVIFAVSALFITLAPIFDFGSGLMKGVCVGYAAIISCMVGKALSNLLNRKTPVDLVLAVGSVLFFFSDLMLLLNNFAKVSAVTGMLCLATYYPAECLLAYSIYRFTRQEGKCQKRND